MSYEASGKIVKIFDVESKSASFQAREFVIEVADGKYPQMIKFQLTQDRCSLVDRYNAGNEVKVAFDLRGREWNEKYFTNLNAWKIDSVSTEMIAPAQAPTSDSSFPTEEPIASGGAETKAEDFDDLPF